MTTLLRFPLLCQAVILALAAHVLAPRPAHAQDVRIRLFDREAPEHIMLFAHERAVRLYAGDHADPFLEMEAGQAVSIAPEESASEFRVSSDALTLYAKSLRAEPSEGALFGVAAGDEAPRRYAGDLLVSLDPEDQGLQLVNLVPLEAYVASVVSTEYGLDDLEGSKAMAVLARTYALRGGGKFGPEYHHVDDTRSQVYRGQDAITPLALRAARSTEGEVLTWRGNLIQAVYHSSSGGHTAHNESVWRGSPVPYLRGKPDPYGRQSPHAEWTSRLSRAEILAGLSEKSGGEVIGFLLDGRSPDGRVASVSLLLRNGERPSMTGNAFRLVVIGRFGARSLRSMRFEAERQGDEYVFTGQGYGHGVGLSQWGAHDMAKRGMSSAEILDFYYAGVTLSRLKDMDIPPAASPAPDVEETPVRTSASPKTRRIGW